MQTTTTTKKRSRGRWDDAPEQQQKKPNNEEPTSAQEKAAALKNSIKERLAALKRQRGLSSSSSTNENENKVKKAKVYDVDLSITKPNREKESYAAKEVPKEAPKEAPKEININPYLSTSTPSQEDTLLDTRLVGGKVEKKRTSSKQLNFITPGSYIAQAEKKRAKAEKALASGFLSGRKEGTYIKSIGIGIGGESYYDNTNVEKKDDVVLAPRFDAPEYSIHNMPCVLEWWDMEYIPSKLRKQIAALESKQIALQQSNISKSSSEEKIDNEVLINESYESFALKYSKTSTLIQHPVPIKPTPNYKPPSEANTSNLKVHLTKRELKRQRKLRRAEKAREQQDLQAAGVIPPPEPRLTLSNFMKVMGENAVLDPSTIEKKVMEQIQARKLKHEKMNEERKLTPKERSLKKQRKLAEDTSGSVTVALFYVMDMSHVYHRTKVDLNAIQSKITGGVLECEHLGVTGNRTGALVIAEGGPKAIKRFIRLMCVRMKWTGADIQQPTNQDDDTQTQTVSLTIRMLRY